MIAYAQGLQNLFPPEEKHAFINLVLSPPREAGRAMDAWTYRSLQQTAKHKGIMKSISLSTIHQWLHEASLKPWQSHYWLNSKDPRLAEKTQHIVGLYLNPPQEGVVLCVDEKTGMQAKERLYPDKPMIAGIPLRKEFEYIRHGTQSLIASFEVQNGIVFGRIYDRHRQDEFCDFLRQLLVRYPEKQLHIVLDNLNTHKTDKVKELVATACNLDFNSLTNEAKAMLLTKPNKRIVFHFLPTHASWLNQIEIWFSMFSKKCLKHGNFSSKEDLKIKAMNTIKDHNMYDARPFKWTYTGQPLTV